MVFSYVEGAQIAELRLSQYPAANITALLPARESTTSHCFPPGWPSLASHLLPQADWFSGLSAGQVQRFSWVNLRLWSLIPAWQRVVGMGQKASSYSMKRCEEVVGNLWHVARTKAEERCKVRKRNERTRESINNLGLRWEWSMVMQWS